MEKINENNLISISTRSKPYFRIELATGQKWVFTEHKIEIHDTNGKIKGFMKNSILFANNGDSIFLRPFA